MVAQDAHDPHGNDPHAHAIHAHAAPTGFIRKYIFSLDHKVIGLQYYFLALTAVFVGMFLSLLMRIHMIWPTANLPLLGEIKPETYLSLLTMHGTIMVFFVLTTAPQGGFGNYFLPIQIGAPDMAFPVLNMLSFWTTFIAFMVILAAFFVTGGAPLHGWTGYAPLSALPSAGPGEQLGADLWITSIAIFCVASLMGALNFITTMLDLRAKGMTMMRMPLTVWAWFITAILGLLAFGVLLSAGILLLLDRNLGTSFYVPLVVVNGQIMGHKGGSPLLWQHLFWFFGHPEVYIAILPGMGVASQLLSTFSRKPIFGYKAMVYAIMAIGFLGFMVWGHHMFMSGMSPYSAFAFSIMTMAIGVPSAIKTFNWLGTIRGGRVRFQTPMLYAIGFVSLFVSGGSERPLPGATGARYSAARHGLCRRTLPSDHGCGRHLRHVRRDLLLVSQDVRPHDERDLGPGALLHYAGRDLRHLHADALFGYGGTASPVFAVHRTGLPASSDSAEPIHHLRGDHHHLRPVHLCDQSILEHVQGTEGQRQSVGSDHAGMDDGHAASA